MREGWGTLSLGDTREVKNPATRSQGAEAPMIWRIFTARLKAAPFQSKSDAA